MPNYGVKKLQEDAKISRLRHKLPNEQWMEFRDTKSRPLITPSFPCTVPCKQGAARSRAESTPKLCAGRNHAQTGRGEGGKNRSPSSWTSTPRLRALRAHWLVFLCFRVRRSLARSNSAFSACSLMKSWSPSSPSFSACKHSYLFKHEVEVCTDDARDMTAQRCLLGACALDVT